MSGTPRTMEVYPSPIHLSGSTRDRDASAPRNPTPSATGAVTSIRAMTKKKLVGSMKLQVPAGQANPSPPVGPALGQRGINIMEFCKAFNAKTQDMEPGAPCPTLITYYQDKSFTMDIKTPPASYYLKKAAGLKPVGKRNRPRGSEAPGRQTVATVTIKQVREIAEAKMKDLSANDVESAMQIILGSAKSMGIEVK